MAKSKTQEEKADAQEVAAMKLELDNVGARTDEINSKVEGMQEQVAALNKSMKRMESLLKEKHGPSTPPATCDQGREAETGQRPQTQPIPGQEEAVIWHTEIPHWRRRSGPSQEPVKYTRGEANEVDPEQMYFETSGREFQQWTDPQFPIFQEGANTSIPTGQQPHWDYQQPMTQQYNQNQFLKTQPTIQFTNPIYRPPPVYPPPPPVYPPQHNQLPHNTTTSILPFPHRTTTSYLLTNHNQTINTNFPIITHHPNSNIMRPIASIPTLNFNHNTPTPKPCGWSTPIATLPAASSSNELS
ncbi:hypothetical protein VPH35_129309 [Triticum aestivum]